jgi:hypothetical protein
MPISETLVKIEGEIACGDYGKARDRLRGLLSTYPNDLGFRRRLGDVYQLLECPTMAGRYWYLEQDKSPDMIAACRHFERTCRDNPLEILLCLKFRGGLESLESSFAKQTLEQLRSKVAQRYRFYIHFEKKGAERYEYIPNRLERFLSPLGRLSFPKLVLLGIATGVSAGLLHSHC